MRRLTIGPRAVTTAGGALLALGALLIAVSVVVSTSAAAKNKPTGPSITVSPHTHLKAGSHVVIRGRGLVRLANGALLECNSTPGEPATVATVHGVSHAIPVGCTAALPASTNDMGQFTDFRLVILTGALGTWETGTDSSGGSAPADSANYPCPPTQAQLNVGASCVIEFLDNKNQLAIRTISFKGQGTTPTTTTTTTTTTTIAGCDPAPRTVTANGSTVTVNPGTCLVNGQTVSLTGSFLTPNAAGEFIECNSDPSQPTVAIDTANVPVSCSDPFGPPGPGIVDTSSSGAVGPSPFSIVAGTVGPPCGPSSCSGSSSTDSSGGNPFTDAATYPCPPTAAQASDGDVCVIAFGDDDGDSVTVPISFLPTTGP
jgi:hypothetical protein